MEKNFFNIILKNRGNKKIYISYILLDNGPESSFVRPLSPARRGGSLEAGQLAGKY